MQKHLVAEKLAGRKKFFSFYLQWQIAELMKLKLKRRCLMVVLLSA